MKNTNNNNLNKLYTHIPVMKKQVLEFLKCESGKIYVDCTLGGCGHAKVIYDLIGDNGLLIGIDQDIASIQNAANVFNKNDKKVKLFHSNYSTIANILINENIKGVDGILLDLGLSTFHIKESGRGFSFNLDEQLDMRMDTRIEITAFSVINEFSEKDLSEIFFKYGEERFSRQIAKRIVKLRKKNPIKTSKELGEIVFQAVPIKKNYKIHPATRTFMALRIFINKELEHLEKFLNDVYDFLNPGARLCIISFHSLEDRIVKMYMKKLSKDCSCPSYLPKCICNTKKQVNIITKKVIRPDEFEIKNNPLARSAKLRCMEKILVSS